MIATIAAHQVTSLRRQRVVVVMLAMLLTMTAMAGVIGWSAHHTIVGVYDQATQLLSAEGGAAPPSPFARMPSLSLVLNMVIYIPLLGALLAVVLGHLSLIDDRADGVGRLVFTRPVSRADYALGKILGIGALLAAATVASLVVTVGALVAVDHHLPAPADLGRLLGFFAWSLLYELMFALVGMAGVLVARGRPLALMSALGTWLVLTFALPQVTSGLRPTASLNPVTDPVGTSQALFQITAKLRPLSVSEQYKQVGTQLLGTAPAQSAVDLVGHVVPVAGLTVAAGWLVVGLLRRTDYARSAADV